MNKQNKTKAPNIGYNWLLLFGRHRCERNDWQSVCALAISQMRFCHCSRDGFPRQKNMEMCS